MRWVWIDRFLSFESGKSARAVKNLSLAEDYFADHFPGYPVMPACFILEGLAQTGGILSARPTTSAKVVLAKFPSAKFHREAWPANNSFTRRRSRCCGPRRRRRRSRQVGR
jgi:3-hydroxyacyl-[acyl-carrier-protein] dehydratase